MKRKYVAALLPMPSGIHSGLTLFVIINAHSSTLAHTAAEQYFQKKVSRSEPLAVQLLKEITEVDVLLAPCVNLSYEQIAQRKRDNE